MDKSKYKEIEMNKCPNCGKRTDALYTSEYHAVTHCGCFYDENNKHCI